MKALVTGAGGFIGSFLSKALLDSGHEVRGLFLPTENADTATTLGIDVYRGDLTRPKTLKGIGEGVDTVFHLAARVSDWGSHRVFRKIMVDGTRHLLEACHDDLKRFVYVSSIAALGLGRDLVGLDESAERIRCGIPYCDTKIDAENLVAEGCGNRHIPYTIVRPANVIGPGSAWVRDVLDAFLDGPMPLVAKGAAPGAFVYVENLVDGMMLAAESDTANGKTYHFRDDYPLTWGEYLTTVGSWIGRKPSLSLPFKAAWSLGAFLEIVCRPMGIRPPITRLAAGVLGRNNDVDCSAARKDLGWESRVSQHQAMQEIENWVNTCYQPPKSFQSGDFHNCLIYITGGSSGIGLAIARLLARKGAHLALLARNESGLTAARTEIEADRRSPHQQVTIVPVDVADSDDVKQKLDAAVKETGPPDILINSAGIIVADHFDSISADAFDAVIKTNLYGVRHVITALLPHLKSRGSGQVINISSAAGLMGMFGYTAYGASKFGLVGFSDALRSELKPHGISVSVACPPEVKTPMIEKESETLPREAKTVKLMAGSLTVDYAAKAILKGIVKKKFLIIPGRKARFLYYSQRITGLRLSHAVSDKIIQFIQWRQRKKDVY